MRNDVVSDGGRLMVLKNSFLIVILSLLSANTSAENREYELAIEYGIKACANQIKELSELVLKDKEYDYSMARHPLDPDNRMYSSLSIVLYGDGDSHLTISASPNPAGKCDITYLETFFDGAPCDVARTRDSSGWTFVGYTGRDTVVTEDNSGMVGRYFSPQLGGKACMISIRTVVYSP